MENNKIDIEKIKKVFSEHPLNSIKVYHPIVTIPIEISSLYYSGVLLEMCDDNSLFFERVHKLFKPYKEYSGYKFKCVEVKERTIDFSFYLWYENFSNYNKLEEVLRNKIYNCITHC